MGSFPETYNDPKKCKEVERRKLLFVPSLLLPFPLPRCFSCSNKFSKISRYEWTRPYIVPLSDQADRSWSSPGFVL